MNAWIRGVFSVVVLSTCGALKAEAPKYRVQDLSAIIGMPIERLDDLNNHGDFTLHATDGMGYLYRGGKLHAVTGTEAAGLNLNDRGDVVGDFLGPDFKPRPFLFRNGRLTDLSSALGASQGSAYAINESGQIVGTADGKAFIYDGTQVSYLNTGTTAPSKAYDINDHGVIVGEIRTEFTAFAFEYRNGRTSLLPRIGDTVDYQVDNYARRINSAGAIVLDVWDSNTFLAYSRIYDNGSFLKNTPRYIFDINDQGWAAGARELYDEDEGDFITRAVLYQNGQSYDLQEHMRDQDAMAWQKLYSATAINDKGQIVGMGRSTDGTLHPYMATPVPELSIHALMMVGVVFVGAIAHRQRRPEG